MYCLPSFMPLLVVFFALEMGIGYPKIKYKQDEYCSTSTFNKKNALGVNVRGYFPCNWLAKPYSSIQKEGIVCQYGIWENDVFNSFSIGVTVVDEELSKEEIQQISESDNFQDILPAGSTYISSKSITIDGVHGIRLVLKKNFNNAVAYTTDAVLYKGNRAIIISYGVAGSEHEKVFRSFQNKKATFEKMCDLTEFLY